MIPLDILHSVPEGLLELTDSRAIGDIMPHPTLLHLPGNDPRPLFLTVLLHGNEDTGLLAVQTLLRKYAQRPLPRALSIFFGNVYAAQAGLRRLKGQPDYNRVWPGGDHEACDETALIAEVTQIMRDKRPFASVDIHNNTGKNPHYGCINRLKPDFLHLAALFGPTIVFFETPKGVQSLAFADLCPAITIECGKPGVPSGTEHAAEFVDALLHLHTLHPTSLRKDRIDVYHTVARVSVSESISFSFHDADADLRLLPELERDNFSELPAGTAFGFCHSDADACLEAFDDKGSDRTAEYFSLEAGQIVLKKPMMPSMITLDERIIRQDCFCYLMERIIPPYQEN